MAAANDVVIAGRVSNREQPRPRYRVQFRPPGGMRNGMRRAFASALYRRRRSKPRTLPCIIPTLRLDLRSHCSAQSPSPQGGPRRRGTLPTYSPSSPSRASPQHPQAVCGATVTRSRGRCCSSRISAQGRDCRPHRAFADVTGEERARRRFCPGDSSVRNQCRNGRVNAVGRHANIAAEWLAELDNKE